MIKICYDPWKACFVSFLCVLMQSSQHIGWPVIFTKSIPDHSTTSFHNLHLFVYFLETGFCLLWSSASLTLVILQPQLPECFNYRHVLVCPADLYLSPFYVKNLETGKLPISITQPRVLLLFLSNAQSGKWTPDPHLLFWILSLPFQLEQDHQSRCPVFPMEDRARQSLPSQIRTGWERVCLPLAAPQYSTSRSRAGVKV